MNVKDAGADRRLDRYEWTEPGSNIAAKRVWTAKCSVSLRRTEDGGPESIHIVDYRLGVPKQGEETWETFDVAAADLPHLCANIEVATGRTAQVDDLPYLLSQIGSVQKILQFLDNKGIAYKHDCWVDNDN